MSGRNRAPAFEDSEVVEATQPGSSGSGAGAAADHKSDKDEKLVADDAPRPRASKRKASAASSASAAAAEDAEGEAEGEEEQAVDSEGDEGSAAVPKKKRRRSDSPRQPLSSMAEIGARMVEVKRNGARTSAEVKQRIERDVANQRLLDTELKDGYRKAGIIKQITLTNFMCHKVHRPSILSPLPSSSPFPLRFD